MTLFEFCLFDLICHRHKRPDALGTLGVTQVLIHIMDLTLLGRLAVVGDPDCALGTLLCVQLVLQEHRFYFMDVTLRVNVSIRKCIDEISCLISVNRIVLPSRVGLRRGPVLDIHR